MRYLYLTLIFMMSVGASAQTFTDLNDRKGQNMYGISTPLLYLRYTNFSDPYTETVSGLTFNASVRVGGERKGQSSWHFENPTLGDFLYVLLHWKKSQESTINKSFGSGFVGWHQVYFNAVVRQRFIFAPGFSFGDYIFGIEQKNLTTEPRILEPDGYYFHLGPAVKLSYVLTSKLWLEGFVHNDIGFKASNQGGNYQNIEGYKKPFFFNVGANIYSTAHLFGGFRVVNLIDRGPNDIKATRLDISAGYMF